MNVDKLHTIIENPFLGSEQDLVSLKELCVKFPYAQLFSIIYLKALKNNNDFRFEEELSKNAFKISNREKLYELILQNNENSNRIVEDKEEVSIEKSETNSKIDKEVIPEKEETILKPNIGFIKNEVLVDENLDKELEKEYLSAIISSSYNLEKEEATKISKENIKESKRSFSSWLKINEKNESDKNVKIKNEIKPINAEKSKAEFFNPSKKAKESISEDKLIYSETLANIFAMQGNYPKAILAFQQLMLTFPEKKRYFAKKIEELNKKINLK